MESFVSITVVEELSKKYKIISKLAIRLLCIPATSAPSERVFSVAGLTIAKDRSKLAAHTAHELIFLQDAIPGLRRFEESKLSSNSRG